MQQIKKNHKTRKKKEDCRKELWCLSQEHTLLNIHRYVELVLIITLVYYSLKKQLSYDRALTNTIILYSQSIY